MMMFTKYHKSYYEDSNVAYLSIKKASEVIQKRLNAHFEVDYPQPKIKVFKSPQVFFNEYTGKKRRRPIELLTNLDTNVSYFYDHVSKTICIKGFKRNGERKFETLKEQTMKFSDLLHEHVHHIQTLSGGYSRYNLFDEGCCEVVSYVLTGDIPNVADYNNFIRILWNLLDASCGSLEAKYDLIKRYNVSKSKTRLAHNVFDAFIAAHPKLNLSRDELSKECENETLSPRLNDVLDCYEQTQITNELFHLYDSLKVDNSITKLIKCL